MVSDNAAKAYLKERLAPTMSEKSGTFVEVGILDVVHKYLHVRNILYPLHC